MVNSPQCTFVLISRSNDINFVACCDVLLKSLFGIEFFKFTAYRNRVLKFPRRDVAKFLATISNFVKLNVKKDCKKYHQVRSSREPLWTSL